MSAEVCGTTRCSGCRELALLAENERLRAALVAVGEQIAQAIEALEIVGHPRSDYTHGSCDAYQRAAAIARAQAGAEDP